MTNFILRELDRAGAKDKMNGGASPSVSASGLRQRRRGSSSGAAPECSNRLSNGKRKSTNAFAIRC